MQEGCNKGKQHAELHIFVAAPQKAPAGPGPAKIPFQHPTGAARRWRAPNEAARALVGRSVLSAGPNNNSGRPATTTAEWPALSEGWPAAGAGRPR